MDERHSLDPEISYSDSALRVAIAKLLWMYTLTSGLTALFCIIYMVIGRIILWKVTIYTQTFSAVDLSLLVGIDIGMLVVIVFLVVLVPKMIMTWTTALVLEFAFDRKHRSQKAIVKNGTKLARELSIATVTNALKGGEIAAIVSGGITLVFLTLVRTHINDTYAWNGM